MAKLDLLNYLLLTELRGYEERKRIDTTYGRIIEIHTGGENDKHHTPHFHVEYAGKSGEYNIEDCSKIKGNLSRVDDKKIKMWYEKNLELLILAWDELYPEIPVKIKEKV